MFVSTDITGPLSANMYAYCENNPVNNSDPKGEFWNTIIGGVAGALIGGIAAAIKGEDVLSGCINGGISGAISGAMADIAIATGGAGIAVLIAIGGIGSATASYSNQRMNGKSHDEVDWGEVAIDGVFGMVGTALTIGTAGVGSSQVQTARQIISKPLKKVAKQAAEDFAMSTVISFGAWLNGEKLKMVC